MSEGFGKVHQSYLRHQREAAGKENDQEQLYNWDDFKPRLIPFSALEDHAPWKQYSPIPSRSKDPKAELERLPSSMALLLELCTDVVDTTPLVLMQYVRNVEWYIVQEVLPTFQQRDSAPKRPQEPGTGPQESGTGPQEPGMGGMGPQELGKGRQKPRMRPREPGTRPQEPGKGPRESRDHKSQQPKERSKSRRPNRQQPRNRKKKTVTTR